MRSGNRTLPWDAHGKADAAAHGGCCSSGFCTTTVKAFWVSFFLIQYSPHSLSLNVSFHINAPGFPHTRSSLVLEVLILCSCAHTINDPGKQTTNSKACGCNASSVGQQTRVQIPGIQMCPGAQSSPSSAQTPFPSMRSCVGDALGWLFQSLRSPCGGNGWLWGRGAW